MINLRGPEKKFGLGMGIVRGCMRTTSFCDTTPLHYEGKLQGYKSCHTLKAINPLTPELRVSTDNRVYKRRHGLINCLVPAKPTGTEEIYITSIDYTSLPPPGELAWLYDNFFSKYNQEVLMLVGKQRNGTGWVYHVPEQIGSSVSVEWEANDEEMGEFLVSSQWIGTLHIHPGKDSRPSQQDIDDWAEPEKSGLHIIFGRDGTFMVYGSIAGFTFPILYSPAIAEANRVPVSYTTSQGRTLAELLKEPVKEPTRLKYVDEREWEVNGELETDREYIEETLEGIGSLPLSRKDLSNLHLVTNGSNHHLVTNHQLMELINQCTGVCSMPTHKRVVTRPKKRGRKCQDL